MTAGIAGFNPTSFFGAQPAGAYSGNPFTGANKNQQGRGLEGLPDTFAGWTAPARYSFAPAGNFVQGVQPVADFFQNEMNTDYGSQLFGQSSQIIDSQFADAKRQQQDQLQRAGMGGGSAVSPLASLALNEEAAARSGAYGTAARQSVLQAQQMKSQAAQSFQQTLAAMMQAMMAPAQFQASRNAAVPIGQVGPSPQGLIGPGLNALGGLLNFAGS